MVRYNTPAEKVAEPIGAVGVDRNSVGAIATLADPQNGEVLHLGYNPGRTKEVWARRKANLQSAGKRRLLHRVRNKQSRRTKHENHVVSKQIVDYAAKHRRCVVLEKLAKVRKGKMRRSAERACWSFHQLSQFIRYKAPCAVILRAPLRNVLAAINCPGRRGSLSGALIVDTMTTETLTRHSFSHRGRCLSVE